MQFHRNFDMAVSQAEHPEVFEGIKYESEGIKLVKQTAAHLVNRGNTSGSQTGLFKVGVSTLVTDGENV